MRRFGLIGHPIAHSGSPALFAEWCGGRWPYDLIEGADFEASWQRFLDGYDAINITAPFKEEAFKRVMGNGTVDEGISDIGAINIAVKTIFFIFYLFAAFIKALICLADIAGTFWGAAFAPPCGSHFF